MPLDSEHFRFTPRTLRARRGSLRAGETAGRDGRLLPTIATGGEGVGFDIAPMLLARTDQVIE